MFASIRLFSLISALFVILAALGAGMYFRSVAENDLKALVEKNNLALSQGFINATWKDHRAVLKALSQIPLPEWRKYKEFHEFRDAVLRYFEGTPVATVNLYTTGGAVILSTDEKKRQGFSGVFTMVKDPQERGQAFDTARTGNSFTQVLADVEFPAPDGSLSHGTVVHTLVPILSDHYVTVLEGSEDQKADKMEGMIELFYDVTPQWRQTALFQMVSSGGIIGIFVVLIAVLLFTSKRSEAIIAKQHEANLELASAAARAEAQSRDKSQFLANISHELRTPLNAIIGFSEIMKNELMTQLENTQYMDYIRDIHSSGSHLLSLINDILDYSKAEAGKLDLELSEVNITKIITNSMRLVGPRAEAAEVILVENIPKEQYVLTTDAKKLKQVMLNLLSNAVKFTPASGEVKVTLWQNVMDKSLTIEVKDSGIGIAPKDISRAMAPFGQVDSALSRKYEGTGLGLPLTKKFVELMGGTFSISSEIDKGTTITFTLPATPPAKD